MWFFIIYPAAFMTLGGYIASLFMRKNVESSKEAVKTLRESIDRLLHDARVEGFKHGEQATRSKLLGRAYAELRTKDEGLT